MKIITLKLLLVLSLIATAGYSQKIEINTTDKATGNRFITTSNNKDGEFTIDDSVAQSGALFFAIGYQSNNSKGKQIQTYYIDLIMIHNDNRVGCVQQSTGKITLVLKDGSEMECYQISDDDCNPTDFKAAYALKARGESAAIMDSNFKKLMETEIVQIKVTTSEKTLNYKIKKEERQYLKNHFIVLNKTIGKS